MDNWQKLNYHPLPLRWFVLTVNLTAFKITLESNLWTWFWVSFYIKLVVVGSPILTVGSIIPWVRVPGWLKGRKGKLSASIHLSLLPDCSCDGTSHLTAQP